MAKNAYFQLIHKGEQLWLQVFKESENVEMFSVEELVRYFDRRKINDYNLVEMNNYIRAGVFSEPFFLLEKHNYPENEEMTLRIEPGGVAAVARFYPPSTQGRRISKEEILSTLGASSIKHGIDTSVIDEFLKNPEYCKDYFLAKATLPRHGKDAEVVYHFNIASAKPKQNEDGSVDFHDLGNITSVVTGDCLATLIPADLGEAGISVLGNPIQSKKVKQRRLSYGRNITLSEDRLNIYSNVSGHVTLVEELVMVSDIYRVAANVDASTGDVVYAGTVHVSGNILTGYKVKAEGDIVVNGVVEGAILEAGGNIILKRGVQGMSKACLQARGNIVSKYFENCTVIAEGGVICDSMMHTNVECKQDVEVLGRKGLVTGGMIQTFGNITVTNAGSLMGTTTKLEILSDTEIAKRIKELDDKRKDSLASMQKMDQVLMLIRTKVQKREPLTKDQENYLKIAAVNRRKVADEYEAIVSEMDGLQEQYDKGKNVRIRVEGTVFSGVKIVVKDATKYIRDTVVRAEYRREGADIRVIAI